MRLIGKICVETRKSGDESAYGVGIDTGWSLMCFGLQAPHLPGATYETPIGLDHLYSSARRIRA